MTYETFWTVNSACGYLLKLKLVKLKLKVRSKVKIVPCLIEHRGDEWSTSCSERFNHGETAPGTHFTEECTRPRASLAVVASKRISAIARNQTRHVYNVGSHLSHQATQVHRIIVTSG